MPAWRDLRDIDVAANRHDAKVDKGTAPAKPVPRREASDDDPPPNPSTTGIPSAKRQSG